MGYKEYKNRPPPSAAQTPPPEARGRREEADWSTGVSMGLAASSRVASPVGLMGRIGNVPFVFLIRVYRFVLSPVIGGQCRFEPTCSRYGLEAYRLHGPIRGTRMTAGRICRCHPWNKGGFDPVRIPDGAGIVQDEGAQDGRLDQQEGDEDGATPGGPTA